MPESFLLDDINYFGKHLSFKMLKYSRT